jgi:hypothetical protein
LEFILFFFFIRERWQRKKKKNKMKPEPLLELAAEIGIGLLSIALFAEAAFWQYRTYSQW